ncbi:unnamed protein product [Periconia digitata]|uniref:Uncharacterized protein n=1 Tax=Periconia digitata TaxID=1303443 RepID=A0A9W4XGH7_9PLEO|nr:unnamed protein product [Periconia digitata]
MHIPSVFRRGATKESHCQASTTTPKCHVMALPCEATQHLDSRLIDAIVHVA